MIQETNVSSNTEYANSFAKYLRLQIYVLLNLMPQEERKL